MTTNFLVDTHCHLNILELTDFDGNIANVLLAANKQDVKYFLNVAVDLENVSEVIAIANKFPNVFASIGLHPNEKVSQEPTLNELLTLASEKKVIAIGETGLDYFRSEGDLRWQRERFVNHITAAKELGKPIIVHSRQAKEDTIKILKQENAEKVRGILHCFTEDWEMAKQAIDLGFYISFSGIITFKNAQALQEVVKKIPLECLLIETDAPFLAPVPFRGKTNQPAYVRYVAEAVAELKNISYLKVAEQTSQNFFNLFKNQLSEFEYHAK